MSHPNTDRDERVATSSDEERMTAPSLRQQTLNLIRELMSNQQISRSALAGRLGLSRAHITQTLREDSNLELNTVEKIGNALGVGLYLTTTETESDIALARQTAGHTEESGEVCAADCLACRRPVLALIQDLRDARNLAFQRGRQIERIAASLQRAVIDSDDEMARLDRNLAHSIPDA